MNTGIKQTSAHGMAGTPARSRFFRAAGLNGRSAPREEGMTAVGFIVLAIFVGLFAYGAILLTPVYLNYMKVAGVLDGVFEEFDSQNPTRAEIRNSVSRRFGVESVSVISYRDIKVTPDSGGFLVQATYDHTTPFIGNIHFTVKFDKGVLVRR
jgi:hypothetical protein